MLQMRNAVLALVAATTAAACGGSGYGGSPTDPGPGPGDGKTVNATASLAFTPASLTVNAGDQVTFAFGSVAHNVFFEAQGGAPTDISGNNANVSVQRSFATAGTYRYTCHIHPSMQGTITVR